MRIGLKPEAEDRAAQIDKICSRLLMGLPLLATASWLLSQTLHFPGAMHPILAVPTVIAVVVAAIALFIAVVLPITIAMIAADVTEEGTKMNKVVGTGFSLVFTFALLGLFFAQVQAEAKTAEAPSVTAKP